MTERWRGHAPPHRSRTPIYDVVWPQVGSPVEGTMLANSWLGIPIHWEGERKKGTRRSTLCLGLPACKCCALKIPQDWRGYMPMLNADRSRVVVCVLGRDGYGAVSALVREGKPLSGHRLIVSRLGASNYGPVWARLSVQEPAHWKGQPPDITATLATIYGPGFSDWLESQPDPASASTSALLSLPAPDSIPFPTGHKEQAS